MSKAKLIHAFTNPGADAPPYINVGRLDDGSVRVIVRGAMYPNGSSGTEEIVLSEANWRSLTWSVFAETNDREREAGRPAFDLEEACPSHVASVADPKVCGRCGIHIDSLRPD